MDLMLMLAPVLIVIGTVIGLYLIIRLGNIARYVPNDSVGVVEKIWSQRGSLGSGFIALRGEAGYQPEIVRGGIHFFFPFMYRIHIAPLVTVGQGTIGYVFARDGLPLEPSQTLASNADAFDFYDVRAFLTVGGQKGPQRRLLREGTHAINTAQFAVLTAKETYAVALSKEEEAILEGMRATIESRKGFAPVVIRDADDVAGIVTTHDGATLRSGEIIAPEVEGHDGFQDADRFISAGGHRGRQLQVLVEGTWFINRLFATVDPIAKTTIEVGFVGVVVSYTGPRGADTSGELYHHGELVETGHRGVWRDPLLPGKYAFNTFAGKVIPVPTTNFVLKWQHNAAGVYKFDENLNEISLITKDAFEPLLPLSVVLHIHYRKAPELIQRFGDVKRLVEATLDPMVSSYFKNLAQQRTLVELLQKRDEIQKQSSQEMRERFLAYTLEFQEVLIGTPRARDGDPTIETILVQLRSRQIADEQILTFRQQQRAADTEKDLNQAIATAAMQTQLTESLVRITVQENMGSGDLAQATKDAERVRITAEAQARRIYVEGEATAKAAKLQVDAYGGPEYRLSQEIAKAFFDALQQGHQDVVPQVYVAGGGGSAEGGSIGAILSGLLSASMLKPKRDNPVVPFSSAAE